MTESLASITAYFSSRQTVAKAIRAAELAGITIDVLPSESDTDKTVAAEAYAMHVELNGNGLMDAPTNRGCALQAMNLGGAVVHIISPDVGSSHEALVTSFWTAYVRVDGM